MSICHVMSRAVMPKKGILSEIEKRSGEEIDVR